MRKQSLATRVVYLFLAVCTIAMCLLPRPDDLEREKRHRTEFPEVTAAGLLDGTVQESFEKWFADAFPLRDFWVGLNAYWKLAEGRNLQQKVIHAADDYLINAPTSVQQEQVLQNLTRFDQFAETTGLPASLILVPSPGVLNEDKLPDGHTPYPDDDIYALAADTLSSVILCDPRTALIDANQSQPVCYRTDHHLTAWGNYALYNRWCALQGLSCRSPDDYTITSYDGFYGTTWSASGYWFTPPDPIELWDAGLTPTVTITDGGKDPVVSDSLFFPGHLNDLDKYPVYLDGNHALVQIDNPNALGGSILVIRDSYAHCFAAFLAEQYRTVYLLDLRYYRGSVQGFAEEHAADEVLYLYGLDSILTDSNSAWLLM